MTYYPDLSPCGYFGQWQDVLIAVGWLDSAFPFAIGDVSKGQFGALFDLLREPWQPVVTAGFQRCAFCRFTGGPAELSFGGSVIGIGVGNLFIPASVGVYVTPSFIVHYIDAHGYCPPAEFQEAVLRCPEMKSIAYLREIKAKGLPVLVR